MLHKRSIFMYHKILFLIEVLCTIFKCSFFLIFTAQKDFLYSEETANFVTLEEKSYFCFKRISKQHFPILPDFKKLMRLIKIINFIHKCNP